MSVKNKLAAYLGVFLLACGIFYFFIQPFSSSIMQLRTDILRLKIDMEKRLVKDSNINKINDNMEKIEPQIEKLDQIFVNKNREIEFITTLEDIAVRNNITQKLNLNSAATKESDYSKNNIEITAQGNYNNAINYLRDIEKLNYYINIYALELTGISSVPRNRFSDTADSTTLPGDISFKFSANTYWR